MTDKHVINSILHWTLNTVRNIPAYDIEALLEIGDKREIEDYMDMELQMLVKVISLFEPHMHKALPLMPSCKEKTALGKLLIDLQRVKARVIGQLQSRNLPVPFEVTDN